MHVPAFVCQPRQGEDVDSAGEEAKGDGGQEEPGVEVVVEEDDLHAEIGEDEDLGEEGERLEGVFGADSRGLGGVVIAVMGIANSAEEEGHDA